MLVYIIPPEVLCEATDSCTACTRVTMAILHGMFFINFDRTISIAYASQWTCTVLQKQSIRKTLHLREYTACLERRQTRSLIWGWGPKGQKSRLKVEREGLGRVCIVMGTANPLPTSYMVVWGSDVAPGNNNNNNNNQICIAQVCRMTSEALDGQLQSCYTARAKPKCLTEEKCF